MDNENFQNEQPPQEPKRRSSSQGNFNVWDTVNRIRRTRRRASELRTVMRAAKVINTVTNLIPQVRAAKYIIIGVVIFILLIIFLIIGDHESNTYNELIRTNEPTPTPVLAQNQNISLIKSAPESVNNGENITYTLSLSYSGNGNVLVSDQIPPGTEFFTASGNVTKETDSTGKVTRITWSLNDNLTEQLDQTGPDSPSLPTQGIIDPLKYTQSPYFLATPQADNDIVYSSEEITKANKLGSLINQHQNYLLTKVKNNNPQYTDPFLSVIWTMAIEGSGANPYSWNCNDVSSDINAGCVGWYNSGDWQVGGIQVAQVTDHLADDFREVYGNTNPETVQRVGQKVIDNGNITNPSTFPAISVEELIAQAGKPGSSNVNRPTSDQEAKAQQLIAILLMDPAINAINIALEVAGDIASQDNWLATMQSWGVDYYRKNTQLFSNRMAALATKYTGSYASSSNQPTINKTFKLTVKPINSDFYIENQAWAQEVGGTKPPIDTGSGAGANAETCDGYYILDNPFYPDGTGANFGDPDCTLLIDRNPSDKDKLYSLLKELDPLYADEWMANIIPCESSFNPNTYYRNGAAGLTPDAAGAWGLYQMGRGLNGEYDHGDVDWRKQTTNAINYNKYLEGIGRKWEYWACADYKWGGNNN